MKTETIEPIEELAQEIEDLSTGVFKLLNGDRKSVV